MEIERKFLVNEIEFLKWREQNEDVISYAKIQQGYLTTDDDKSVRIRIVNYAKSYLTIKAGGSNLTRDEYEYEIPIKDGIEIFENLSINKIDKIRICANINNNVWYIDTFLNDNLGLVLCEVEIESEDAHIETPEWVAKEVTGDDKYYNTNLGKLPYNKW